MNFPSRDATELPLIKLAPLSFNRTLRDFTIPDSMLCNATRQASKCAMGREFVPYPDNFSRLASPCLGSTRRNLIGLASARRNSPGRNIPRQDSKMNLSCQHALCRVSTGCNSIGPDITAHDRPSQDQSLMNFARRDQIERNNPTQTKTGQDGTKLTWTRQPSPECDMP